MDWQGPVVHGQPTRYMTVWMKESAVSPPLLLLARASEIFDLVVVDMWDDKAQRSQGKAELRGVVIAKMLRETPREGPPVKMVVLDYASSKMIPGPGTKTAGIGPVGTQGALAMAARKTPTARG